MSKVVEVLQGIVIFIGIPALFIGLFMFLAWDFSEDQKRFDKDCKQIAELAGASDWQTDSSTCYIIKENKIMKVGS